MYAFSIEFWLKDICLPIFTHLGCKNAAFQWVILTTAVWNLLIWYHPHRVDLSLHTFDLVRKSASSFVFVGSVGSVAIRLSINHAFSSTLRRNFLENNNNLRNDEIVTRIGMTLLLPHYLTVEAQRSEGRRGVRPWFGIPFHRHRLRLRQWGRNWRGAEEENRRGCSETGGCLRHYQGNWLIDWFDWPIHSSDWLIDWLFVWLIDWLIVRSFDWLIDWLIDWLSGLSLRLFAPYIHIFSLSPYSCGTLTINHPKFWKEWNFHWKNCNWSTSTSI